MYYHHLAFEERYLIEVLLNKKTSVRNIAEYLGRSPNTVSREVRKNSVLGVYTAKKAHHRAYVKRWRSKRQCYKVVMNGFLHRYVDRRLREKWSPEQISGELKLLYNMNCSAKAVYKFAHSRCLERYLFWGWNKKKGGRKQYRYDTPKDGRKYIDVRPVEVTLGDWEMDFIVSSQSVWVLLVIVNRVTKYTKVYRLPNRKRATVMCALSTAFCGEPVRSITTDNDIAFACWKDIESLLQAPLYFTHPYHSWEKGLVENTNRWIRCFVGKKRDIASVTEKELYDIHSFLNHRPRKIIGFRVPSVYHEGIRVLLRG